MVKNPCPWHPEIELIRRGRADWYCSKCKRNMMLDLVLIQDALEEPSGGKNGNT